MGLYEQLDERERSGAPIAVGLVGAGQMGTGLLSQVAAMRGIDVIAVADIALDRARGALVAAGVADEQILAVDDAASGDEALRAGKRVITTQADLLPRLQAIEAIVEATGVPDLGARIAWGAILGRKHVVLLNVETDATVGPLLKQVAASAGVVYTGSAGDEPAATLELCDFARTLGLEIVCAGKGKNNPLDRGATPETLADRAREVGASPKMLCSFVDGTKTMVEMAALANATGLTIDQRGMHGARTTVKELARTFCSREQGGILERTGVVDFAIGDVAPGVFVVFTSDRPVVVEELRYLQLGAGPNWLLYRPYHLASIETPLSIARAVLRHEPTIQPTHGLVCEVLTVAKRSLRAGETIDGIGGSTVHGGIERAEVAREERCLPLGLAQRAILRRDVERGQVIAYDDVVLDESQTVVQLRRLQDQLLAGCTVPAGEPRETWRTSR